MLAEAAELFRAADRVLRINPGTEHPFYTEDFMPLYNKYVKVSYHTFVLRC